MKTSWHQTMVVVSPVVAAFVYIICEIVLPVMVLPQVIQSLKPKQLLLLGSHFVELMRKMQFRVTSLIAGCFLDSFEVVRIRFENAKQFLLIEIAPRSFFRQF